MRRILFCFLLIFCAETVFSQAGRNIRYVAVQNTPLRASAGFFASSLAALAFGEAVTFISESGRWSRVRAGNLTGWVASSALSTRRVIADNSNFGVSINEVALAGKGFSPVLEIDFQKEGLDFSGVNAMEQIVISQNELLNFINEGRLSRGEFNFNERHQEAPNDDFTLADAYYLGRTVAANVLASYRYWNNPQATQYLNLIARTLAINSLYPVIYKGYFVMILDTDEFNAFASPGGHIFLTRGLVQAVDSEDMLAAVIAHEMAHIMRRHSIAIINDARFQQEMSTIAARAAAVAGTVSPEAARAQEFRSSVTSVINTLMTNGYSHAQEFEADMEAIALLARAGFDPAAYINMLILLQRTQSLQLSGLHSTHPSPALRLANVQGLRFPPNTTRQYRVQRFNDVRF